MVRLHDVNEIDLKVTDVWFSDSNAALITWESNIGFGEYLIETLEHGVLGYSECMDSNEDKDFLKLLLKKASEWIVEHISIEG